MAASTSVEDWVTAIKIATDDKSPFQGKVDLTSIFAEPIEKQWEIFNQLSDETKEKLQNLYGKTS